jgi:flagellar basal-body rod modification protein FlgD
VSNTIDSINSQAGAFEQMSSAMTNGTMGQEDFLKLLVTQLQNQDPLSPMENEQFVAQLAQFSSLEQLVNANERLDTLAIGQMSQNSASAVGFIGKDIRAMADWVEYSGAESTDIHYELMGSADEVTVTIKDDSGKVIRTQTVNSQEEGPHTWAWDGKDNDGNVVSEGSYRISVAAKDVDGATISSFAVAHGRVSGISYENGYPELMIGDHRLALSDVIEVLED